MNATADVKAPPPSPKPQSVTAAAPAKAEWIKRFDVGTRLEHWAMVIVFSGLCLTGIPQKYATSDWAQGLVNLMGGAGGVRFIHRVFGWIFSFQLVFHVVKLVLYTLRRRGPLYMLPNKKDFTDAIGTIQYYLGQRKKHPPYDRYEYKQKFEYWGMVMGSVLMVLTGFILLYPILASNTLPSEVIPIAKAAHSNEGLMALLVIVVWHIYNAVLAPEVFPLDKTMITGKISRERMEHEHPLELARIEGRPLKDDDHHR